MGNQSDSSGSNGATRSTDSGNVSDSNSSNSCANMNTEEIFATDSLINSSGLFSVGELRSMTSMNDSSINDSFEEKFEENTHISVEHSCPIPKKLSNRVAFFENAIKNASGNQYTEENNAKTTNQQIQPSSKKAAFLKAVEKSETYVKNDEEKFTEKRLTENSASHSDNSLYEFGASDPLDEFLEENEEIIEEKRTKPGMLFFTERDMNLKSERKLVKKVAAEIEENGVSGIKNMILKKLNAHAKIKIGILGDSMSGKSTLIKALGGKMTHQINQYTKRIPTCHQPMHFYSKYNEG